MADSRAMQYTQAVQTYVARHLSEKTTVAEIAATLHLHPSYLNTVFRNETGISVKTYVHTVKTHEACRLLRETKHSLTEIGTMLGYFDQSHFNRVFKRCTGLTPGAYRMRYAGRDR